MSQDHRKHKRSDDSPMIGDLERLQISRLAQSTCERADSDDEHQDGDNAKNAKHGSGDAESPAIAARPDRSPSPKPKPFVSRRGLVRRRLYCPHPGCTKICDRQAIIDRHLPLHTVDKPFICSQEGCGKVFAERQKMEEHLRSHTAARPYTCTYEGCTKTFTLPRGLNTHVKVQHQEKSYKCSCDGCEWSFSTAAGLRRHEAWHQSKEQFRCSRYPPCSQPFRKNETLQRHIRTEHLGLAPFECTFVSPTSNQQCDAVFDGATGLRKHQETFHSTRKLFCTFCARSDQTNVQNQVNILGFNNHRQLNAHIKKNHSNCAFCDKKFFSHRELHSHINSQHSGVPLEERKNISCGVIGCTKVFTRRSNLSTHLRTAHNGERFICDTFDLSASPEFKNWDFASNGCEKTFTSKASLEDHVRTAHFQTQSVVNRNRKRARLTLAVSNHDNSSESGQGEQGPESRRSKKQKPDVVEQFLGIDPRRTISCTAEGCDHTFLRGYDLRVHLDCYHKQVPNDESGLPHETTDQNDTTRPPHETPDQSDTADVDAAFRQVLDPRLFE